MLPRSARFFDVSQGHVIVQYLHHPDGDGLRRRPLLSSIQLSPLDPDIHPNRRFCYIACWHLDSHATPNLVRSRLPVERVPSGGFLGWRR